MHRLFAQEAQAARARPCSAPPQNNDALDASNFSVSPSEGFPRAPELVNAEYVEYFYRHRTLNPRLPPPPPEAMNPANFEELDLILSGLGKPMAGGDEAEGMPQQSHLSPWASGSQPFDSLLQDYSPHTGSPAAHSPLLSDLPSSSFPFDTMGGQDSNAHHVSSSPALNSLDNALLALRQSGSGHLGGASSGHLSHRLSSSTSLQNPGSPGMVQRSASFSSTMPLAHPCQFDAGIKTTSAQVQAHRSNSMSGDCLLPKNGSGALPAYMQHSRSSSFGGVNNKSVNDVKVGPFGSHSGRLLGPSKLRPNTLCEQRPDSPPYFDPRMEASAPPTPTQLLPSTPSHPQEILGRTLHSLPSVGGRASMPDGHASAGTPGSPVHVAPHLSSPLAFRTSEHAPAVQSRLSNNTAAEATSPAMAVPRTILHHQHSFSGLTEQEEQLSASPLAPPLFCHRSQSNTQPQSPVSHALPGSPFSRTASMDSNHASALQHAFAAAPAAPQAAPDMGAGGVMGNGGSSSRAGAGVHSTSSSASHSGPLPPTSPLHPPSHTPQQLQSMYMAMAAANSMPTPAGVMPPGPMGLGGYNTAVSSLPMASTAAAAAASSAGYPPFSGTSMPPMPSASFPFGASLPPPSPAPPGLMPMGGMPPHPTGAGYFSPFDAAGHMDMAAMAAASSGGGVPGLGAGMVPPMFPPSMPTPFPTPGLPGMPHLLNPVEYAKYYQKVLETQGGLASGGFPSAHGLGNGMPPWELVAGGSMRGGGGADGLGGMGSFSSSGYGGRGAHAHHHHGGGGKDGMGGSNTGGGNTRPNRMSAFEHVQHTRVSGKGSGDGHHHHHGRHGGHGNGSVNANGVAMHQGGSKSGRGHRKDDAGVPNHGQPLTLLEEFKANKAHRFEFKDLMGHLQEFALDQHGSRFIQQKLEVVSSEEREAALAEVLPQGTTLMTDVFGNYVMQKFLEHGSRECREKVAGVLKGQVLSLSLQMYGCRVMQKALEVLEVDTQCSLIAELDGNIMRCVRDQNGNHVVQKIIECVPTERITGLIDNFLTCVVPLSTHPFGCRVIQRVLEHCQDADRKAVVMAEILKEACHLARDQYGNYVIQHVLEHGHEAERKQIVASLAPEVVSMSMHKFASNVIEKCLAHGSTQDRDLMVSCMLTHEDPLPLGTSPDRTSGGDGGLSGSGGGGGGGGMVLSHANLEAVKLSERTSLCSNASSAGSREGSQAGKECAAEDPLQVMMKDQYGNYVVQKVLEVCDDTQREQLLVRVRAQLNSLKKFTYGKHIVARMEKLLSAGTKIQSHLRARPLPDDQLPLNVRVSGSSTPVPTPPHPHGALPSVAQQQHAAHMQQLQQQHLHSHNSSTNATHSTSAAGSLTSSAPNTAPCSSDCNVVAPAEGAAPLTLHVQQQQQQQQAAGNSQGGSPGGPASCSPLGPSAGEDGPQGGSSSGTTCLHTPVDDPATAAAADAGTAAAAQSPQNAPPSHVSPTKEVSSSAAFPKSQNQSEAQPPASKAGDVANSTAGAHAHGSGAAAKANASGYDGGLPLTDSSSLKMK